MDLEQLWKQRMKEQEELQKPKYVPKEDRSNRETEDSGAFIEDNPIKKPKPLRIAAADMLPSSRRDGKLHFDWDASEDTTAMRKPDSIPMISRNFAKKDPLEAGPELHWTKKTIQNMTPRDWRIFKEDFGIAVSGGNNLPNPIRYWHESTLSKQLRQIIDALGYKIPTPIQRQTIPIAHSGIDFVGLAETGSGKTAAYLLPLIHNLLNSTTRMKAQQTYEGESRGPMGIILVPTRELALQIENEARRLTKGMNFVIASLIGGHSLAEQSISLRNGADIIIATPGRFRDCIEQRVLSISQCSSLVLDEADRMVDMNFEEDLAFIMDALRRSSPSIQISLFSATMQPAIEKIAHSHLKHPFAVIKIGEIGLAVETVSQTLEWISNEAEKATRIVEILGHPDDDQLQFKPPIIVFVNQKTRVEFLARRLETIGWRVAQLHGDKSQSQREAAINSIRVGDNEILVATDVAGRGLDIPNVSLVLNYDIPKGISDYVHRIGRTGRAGALGASISFLTSDDSHIFYDLYDIVKKSPSSASLPLEFTNHEATRTKPGNVSQKRKREEVVSAYGV